jgi:hypothetical protein
VQRLAQLRRQDQLLTQRCLQAWLHVRMLVLAGER